MRCKWWERGLAEVLNTCGRATTPSHLRSGCKACWVIVSRCNENSIVACDIWGYPRAFQRGWPDKLDVYVCSIIDKPFPDRPFRNYQLFRHPNYDELSTKTGDDYADSVFSATLRTIQTVHPRSFVLESATSAAKTDVYNKALECLEKEYLVVKKHCKTRCFGVPQMGARVYTWGCAMKSWTPLLKVSLIGS